MNPSRRKPPGLHWYCSNQMPRLVDELARRVRQPGLGALASEVLVVPGNGLAHWLNQELCRRLGVWANPTYLYPRNFAHWALERLPNAPAEAVARVDPETIFWAVYAELEGALSSPGFESLLRYVANDEGGSRYFQLCRQIARSFDRYLTYRPELVERWQGGRRIGATSGAAGQVSLFSDSGQCDPWQGRLWQRVWRRLKVEPAGAFEQQLDALIAATGENAIRDQSHRGSERSTTCGELPARLSAFGVTNIPPAYLKILVGLSRRVEVHLFLLCSGPAELDAPHPSAVPQLASPLNGEFSQLLRAECIRQGARLERHDDFVSPLTTGSLGQLQRRLLNATPRKASLRKAPHEVAPVGPKEELPAPAGGGAARPKPLPETASRGQAALGAAGDSLTVHSCHGPLREVEVLHDQLLELFAHDPTLQPEHVVVMSPAIDRYAPFVQAVFDRPFSGAERIPYSIADRAERTVAPLLDAFARVVELAEGRVSASAVLDLLAQKAVAEKFGLGASDLDAVQAWVTGSNIRWGMDAEHKQRHGHPADEINSWRFGISRLLLGYAVSPGERELVGAYLPYGDTEGESAQQLGRALEFLDALLWSLEQLSQPQSLSEWATTIRNVFERLFEAGEADQWQRQALALALERLVSTGRNVALSRPVPLSVVSAVLMEGLAKAQPARGYLVGGVTFCSMVPLRSVPFRVVCLMGLSDRDFPRSDRLSDFDALAAGERRFGDPSRRLEDRHLLLEALLSAQERLLITFEGQSLKDNAPLPPSVLVNELLDALGPELAEASVVRHPLHPFSPRYFDGSSCELFSYQQRYLVGARSRAQKANHKYRFLSKPLAVRDVPAQPAVSLAELVRFVQQPTRYIAQKRLGLFLQGAAATPPDREPHELDALSEYGVGHTLLVHLLAGLSEEAAWRLIYATGLLPRGNPAQVALDAQLPRVRGLKRSIDAAMRGGAREPLAVDLDLGSVRLVGELSNLYPRGLVRFQYSKIRAKHQLALWVEHLVLCAAQGTEPRPGTVAATPRSLLLGRDAQSGAPTGWELEEVADARATLQRLCDLMTAGEQQPLHFFPAASYAFARACGASGKPSERAWSSAQRTFEDERARDPYLERFYAGCRLSELSGSGGSFEQLAQEVCQPILARGRKAAPEDL